MIVLERISHLGGEKCFHYWIVKYESCVKFIYLRRIGAMDHDKRLYQALKHPVCVFKEERWTRKRKEQQISYYINLHDCNR